MAGIILDTNVVIDLVGNKRTATRVRRHHRVGEPVYICDIILSEAESKGYKRMRVMSKAMAAVSATLQMETPTSADKKNAKKLEKKDHRFHYPDSVIAAMCSRLDSKLLTFDRGLLEACKKAGICAENP